MSPLDLQNYIHQHIPLTQAMGIAVHLGTSEKVILWAPLTPNLNHKKTAFGVSIVGLCTVSAWALLFLFCKEAGARTEIVIQDSRMRYLRPVHNDFVATSLAPKPASQTEFIETLKEKGKTTIRLRSVLSEENSDDMAAIFDGVFVAQQV
ncbi:MAG: YiiD C-terminal domain-containing protein [Myxococcales bacterium]|nr:MAG: YiiD C-terminal domain-containing protein [Myxococcales bacterium]